MFTTWFCRRIKQLFSNRQLPHARRWAPTFQPWLEALEGRAVPSTVTWDGGSTRTSNWTDRFNWAADVAPVAGDDLVFPASAAQRKNVNNFPSDTLFNSLTFNGTGYSVLASSSRINLGAGGI